MPWNTEFPETSIKCPQKCLHNRFLTNMHDKHCDTYNRKPFHANIATTHISKKFNFKEMLT